MFQGQQHAKFRIPEGDDDFFEKLEKALKPVGKFRVRKNGDIDCRPKQEICNALATLDLTGEVEYRKGAYHVRFKYTCGLSPTGITLLVVGFLLGLWGLLVLLAPFLVKDALDKKFKMCFDDMKDEDEEDEDVEEED